MNRKFFSKLLSGLIVFLVFPCHSMQEERIVSPSLYPLFTDFRNESHKFIEQAQKTIDRLKGIPGDDAYLLGLTLRSNIRTVTLLNELTKIHDKEFFSQTDKIAVNQICRYLAAIMPYAGKMQDVILSVLNKEFEVNSIEGLEAIVK